MKRIVKSIAAVTLGLSVFSAFAAPSSLITHNLTNVESNALIGGVPSPYPSKPNSTNSLSWLLVRIACYGHTVNDECPAVIQMASNTANPIELGEVKMNLTTGEISPTRLSNHGYTLTVNGPGESTLTEG